MMKEISLKKVRGNAKLPVFSTLGASGADLFASAFLRMYTHHASTVLVADVDKMEGNFEDGVQKSIILRPMARVLVGLGFSMKLPKSFEWQIRPRSGMALKSGITVLNTPGTIDEDYRGEVGVILINLGSEAMMINLGDRIAQGVLMPVPDQPTFKFVENLDDTERGTGGFGHTGV